MQHLAAHHYYSPEEYAALEKSSEERLEYFDGNVWSMGGASLKHEAIVSNLDFALRTRLQKRKCRIFLSNTRVKVPIYPPYRYPDLSALCGEVESEMFYGLEVLTNPSLIVEVLSPSTEAFDRDEKFTYYKSIETFTEYLLIAQDRPHVVLYTKRDEKVWLHREFNSLDEIVHLTSLDSEISLAEIYLDIEFPERTRPRYPLEREDFR